MRQILIGFLEFLIESLKPKDEPADTVDQYLSFDDLLAKSILDTKNKVLAESGVDCSDLLLLHLRSLSAGILRSEVNQIMWYPPSREYGMRYLVEILIPEELYNDKYKKEG